MIKKQLLLILQIEIGKKWAVVVVKWSACSPSIPTIRVRFLQKPTVFYVKFVFEKNENKHKEAGVGPFTKKVPR